MNGSNKMATINVNQILKKIEANKSAEGLAYGAALRKFNAVKPQLIGEFQNHPVTKEIEAGESAENLTKTLPEGNLFSFIGFTKGENPLSKLYDLIFGVKLNRFFKNKTIFGKKVSYQFLIEMPSGEKIETATPMPNRWSSESWAKKIENSISGLEYYIYGYGKKFRTSFSTTGLQIKNKLRSQQFTGIKYLTEIFENFEKNLKK